MEEKHENQTAMFILMHNELKNFSKITLLTFNK